MGSIKVTVSAADRDRALRRTLRDDSKVRMHLPAPTAVTSPPAAPVLLTSTGRPPQTIEVSATGRARALGRALRDDTRVKVTL